MKRIGSHIRITLRQVVWTGSLPSQRFPPLTITHHGMQRALTLHCRACSRMHLIQQCYLDEWQLYSIVALGEALISEEIFTETCLFFIGRELSSHLLIH